MEVDWIEVEKAKEWSGNDGGVAHFKMPKKQDEGRGKIIIKFRTGKINNNPASEIQEIFNGNDDAVFINRTKSFRIVEILFKSIRIAKKICDENLNNGEVEAVSNFHVAENNKYTSWCDKSRDES